MTSKRVGRENGGLVDDERDIPEWVFEQAAARKAAGFKMRGLITLIPDEFADNPEVWAAQNGLV